MGRLLVRVGDADQGGLAERAAEHFARDRKTLSGRARGDDDRGQAARSEGHEPLVGERAARHRRLDVADARGQQIESTGLHVHARAEEGQQRGEQCGNAEAHGGTVAPSGMIGP